MEKAKKLHDYPEYIVAAVEWWADEVEARKKNETNIFYLIRDFFDRRDHGAELTSFRNNLAQYIESDLSDYEYSELYIDKHGPCLSLVKSMEDASLSKYLKKEDEKIEMLITKSEVVVARGSQALYKTVWSFLS